MTQRRLFLAAALLQLILAGLMIAVLKRSGFDFGERTQGLDYAGCNHSFIFSSACNVFSGHPTIAPNRKICQAFVAVHIDGLAYGGQYLLRIKRATYPHAAEGILIKDPTRRITAGGARKFVTRRGVGLGESDRVVNAGPAGSIVVAALLWQLGRECRTRRDRDHKCCERNVLLFHMALLCNDRLDQDAIV